MNIGIYPRSRARTRSLPSGVSAVMCTFLPRPQSPRSIHVGRQLLRTHTSIYDPPVLYFESSTEDEPLVHCWGTIPPSASNPFLWAAVLEEWNGLLNTRLSYCSHKTLSDRVVMHKSAHGLDGLGPCLQRVTQGKLPAVTESAKRLGCVRKKLR